jgi:hypothetical protein
MGSTKIFHAAAAVLFHILRFKPGASRVTAQRQPGRYLQMDTFYTHSACFRVISNAPHAAAANSLENVWHGAAQEIQSRFGQERKSDSLVFYIEGDPLANCAPLYPTFEFSDSPFGLDCPDKARKPGAGQPEGRGKGSECP